MKLALEFGPGSIVYVVRRRTLGYEVAHGMVEEIRANTDGIFVRVAGFGWGHHDVVEAGRRITVWSGGFGKEVRVVAHAFCATGYIYIAVTAFDHGCCHTNGFQSGCALSVELHAGD